MPIAKAKYAWLDTLPKPLPRIVSEGLKLHGIVETAGTSNNPVIMGWADELGGNVEQVYTADSVPWCGLFMAVVAQRAGKTPVKDPLWALNWGKFGTPAGQPWLGDVLTFIRPGGGHVGIYIAEDNRCYHVLGGNQSDRVCFDRIEKTRLRAARRTPYMSAPLSAKPYIVAEEGSISLNEG